MSHGEMMALIREGLHRRPPLPESRAVAPVRVNRRPPCFRRARRWRWKSSTRVKARRA
jgi:hypothetical protein